VDLIAAHAAAISLLLALPSSGKAVLLPSAIFTLLQSPATAGDCYVLAVLFLQRAAMLALQALY